jgi:hypothetical protein
MEPVKTPDYLAEAIAAELVDSAAGWADEIRAAGRTDADFKAAMTERFAGVIASHLGSAPPGGFVELRPGEPAEPGCPNCGRAMDHVKNFVRCCRTCH